ncbi:RNA polymerase sigma factor [Candidatus Parcubacteria bacterium]|nr:RNA polymerase sigma factor [Candidatus Parcubacteria bacterium]
MFGYTARGEARDYSDEEILMRSQSEPWLFAVLLERYQDAFLRKAKTVLHNEQDAEEIVQDTFTKIYMNASRFEVREGAKFTSWAYTILMNTAFTRYQKLVKEGKRTLQLDPELWELQGDVTLHSGFEEDKDGIERVLEKLPGHFAYVLRLHYLERWSHKDIARESGETAGAVKARIHRAKEAFRKEAGEASLL